MSYRSTKIDDNQKEIVAALGAAGCSVDSLAAVGGGVPDLLVGLRGHTYLLEVKDGRKVPSARQLTPAQKKWIPAWRGRPVAVVKNTKEALRAVGFDIK